jgi:hypothetical protein
VVLGIAKVNDTILGNADAVRTVELRQSGRSTISFAAELLGPAASYRANLLRPSINPANHLVLCIYNINVAERPDGNTLWTVEGGLSRRSPVAAVAPITDAGNM